MDVAVYELRQTNTVLSIVFVWLENGLAKYMSWYRSRNDGKPCTIWVTAAHSLIVAHDTPDPMARIFDATRPPRPVRLAHGDLLVNVAIGNPLIVRPVILSTRLAIDSVTSSCWAISRHYVVCVRIVRVILLYKYGVYGGYGGYQSECRLLSRHVRVYISLCAFPNKFVAGALARSD